MSANDRMLESLHARLRRLEQTMPPQTPRIASGGLGVGFSIPVVQTLPPIPDTPRLVYLQPDQQIWESGPGCTRWSPIANFTTVTGIP